MDLSPQMINMTIEVIGAFKKLKDKDDIKYAKKGLQQWVRAITDGYGYQNAKFSEELIIKALSEGISLETIRDTNKYDDQIKNLKDKRTKQDGGQKYKAEHKYPVSKIFHDLETYQKLDISIVSEIFKKADMVWITNDENNRLKKWEDVERPDNAYNLQNINIIDLKNEKIFREFKNRTLRGKGATVSDTAFS
jgi:hypothetical protein